MGTGWVRFSAVFLTVLLFFGILTVWVPTLWPIGFLQAAVFALAVAWAAWMRWRPSPVHFSFPLIPLAGAVLWGLLQLQLGWTVCRFESWSAELGSLSGDFLAGSGDLQLPGDPARLSQGARLLRLHFEPPFEFLAEALRTQR